MNPIHKERPQQRLYTPLEILPGMRVGKLEALANAVLTPNRQRHLQNRLRKNQMRALFEPKEKALDEPCEEVDRIALLKAKAYKFFMRRIANR